MVWYSTFIFGASECNELQGDPVKGCPRFCLQKQDISPWAWSRWFWRQSVWSQWKGVCPLRPALALSSDPRQQHLSKPDPGSFQVSPRWYGRSSGVCRHLPSPRSLQWKPCIQSFCAFQSPWSQKKSAWLALWWGRAQVPESGSWHSPPSGWEELSRLRSCLSRSWLARWCFCPVRRRGLSLLELAREIQIPFRTLPNSFRV